MKINELRINNWIEVSGRYAQVEHLLEDKSINPLIGVRDNKGNRCGILAGDDKCKPIPLTEDILLKCGFAWSDIDVCYNLLIDRECDTFIIGDNGRDNYYCSVINKGNYIGTQTKYLHQLQNLYFCLTGKELEIKLD